MRIGKTNSTAKNTTPTNPRYTKVDAKYTELELDHVESSNVKHVALDDYETAAERFYKSELFDRNVMRIIYGFLKHHDYRDFGAYRDIDLIFEITDSSQPPPARLYPTLLGKHAFVSFVHQSYTIEVRFDHDFTLNFTYKYWSRQTDGKIDNVKLLPVVRQSGIKDPHEALDYLLTTCIRESERLTGSRCCTIC